MAYNLLFSPLVTTNTFKNHMQKWENICWSSTTFPVLCGLSFSPFVRRIIWFSNLVVLTLFFIFLPVFYLHRSKEMKGRKERPCVVLTAFHGKCSPQRNHWAALLFFLFSCKSYSFPFNVRVTEREGEEKQRYFNARWLKLSGLGHTLLGASTQSPTWAAGTKHMG